MRKYEKFNGQRWSRRREQGQTFEGHSYDDCEFRSCRFADCRWKDSKFYRVTFADTEMRGCTFENSRFWGQHSYLGPSLFDDCTFRACEFKDVQPWRAAFRNCRFPDTRLISLTFYGENMGFGATTFDHVDMTDSQFSFVGFRGIDLSSVRLPRHGVRVFANPQGQMQRELRQASGVDDTISDTNARFEKCPRRALLILAGDGKTHIVQDPLVHDVDFLASMLSNDELDQFEAIASRYERSPLK